MKRLRILHVVQNLNYGGMERIIAELATGVQPNRFEAHVMGLQYLGRFAEDLHGPILVHTGPRMERTSLLRPARLAAQIRSISPDVVHTHSGVWYKVSLAARMARVPRVIHTDHGRSVPDPVANRVLDHLASFRTDVVVAVSRPLAEYLRERVVRRGTAMCVIANGIDTDMFCPHDDDGTVRRELGITQMAPIIGSIGRLERVKGYDIMIEAFATLISNWSAAMAVPVLVLAGDGTERGRLERLAVERGVTQHVRFVGWHDNVRALFSAFTLFTLSSRSEGTSVSLLEAMSSAVCPIVTDVGGNRDVLGPDLQHRLVAAEDVRALASAWQIALLEEPARISVDGRAARHRVLGAFDVREMVRRYEDLYAGHKEPTNHPGSVSSAT